MPAFIKLLYFLLISFSLSSQAKTNYTVSPVHKHLFMQNNWLNLTRDISEEELAGRIIILDFWTYGCVNCLHVIPELKYLEAKYGDKLTVIGVHSGKFQNEKGNSNIASAIAKYNIRHSVINDHDYKIWNVFGVNAWPTLVLIAPNGIIFSAYTGEGHKDDLDKDISFLLEQYDNINSASLPYLTKTKTTKKLSFPSKVHFAANVEYDGHKQDLIFIADSANNRILALNKNAELIFQIGSGKSGNKLGNFATADFFSPIGITYQNGKLYIADSGNHQIKIANIKRQTVRLLVGNGKRGSNFINASSTPNNIALSSPWDLAFFPDKNSLIIANSGSHQLMQYHLNKKKLNIYAGNGMESLNDGSFPFNSLAQPSALHQFKDNLYFLDTEASALRKIDKKGNVTTLLGTGLFDFGLANGTPDTARMQHPLGLTDDGNNLLIADSYNHRIKKFAIIDSYLDDFLGSTSGQTISNFQDSEFYEPGDISKSNNPYIFYIADTNNHRILKLDLKRKVITKFYP